MGAVRHDCDLVGEFAASVHVLQSIMVACAFSICGGAVLLVLAADARSANRSTVDGAGANCRADAEYLLSQRDRARGNDSGSVFGIPESVERLARQFSDSSLASRLALSILCSCAFVAPADVPYAVRCLWRLLANRLRTGHGMGLELAVVSLTAFFIQSWFILVDTVVADRDGRPVYFLAKISGDWNLCN